MLRHYRNCCTRDNLITATLCPVLFTLCDVDRCLGQGPETRSRLNLINTDSVRPHTYLSIGSQESYRLITLSLSIPGFDLSLFLRNLIPIVDRTRGIPKEPNISCRITKTGYRFLFNSSVIYWRFKPIFTAFLIEFRVRLEFDRLRSAEAITYFF